MLTDTQRSLLIAARKLIQDGKEEVIFRAIRSAFNAGSTEASCDDVASLNDFINEAVIAGIRAGDEIGAWQRLTGMSRRGDMTAVSDRLAWIERLLTVEAPDAE